MVKYLKEIDPSFRGARDNYLYNIIVSNSLCVIRILVPEKEFDENTRTARAKKDPLTKDQLLSQEPLLNGICSYVEHYIRTYTEGENTWCLAYEGMITLNDLKKLQSWHDNGICTLFLPLISRVIYYQVLFGDITAFSWFKSINTNFDRKQVLSFFSRLLRVEPVIHFIVDKATDTLSNTSILFRLPPKCKLISNITPEEHEHIELADLLPSYKIEIADSIKAGEKTSVRVTADFQGSKHLCNTDLTIHMGAGYTAKRTIHLNNGEATFDVRALDLEAGDNLCLELIDHGRLCTKVTIPVV